MNKWEALLPHIYSMLWVIIIIMWSVNDSHEGIFYKSNSTINKACRYSFCICILVKQVSLVLLVATKQLS